MNEPLDLDHAALGQLSQRLAAAVIAAFPEARKHSGMIPGGETDGLSISILFPSPTEDEERCIQVWVDEAPSPSLGFGPTHTHFATDDGGITEAIDLCRAILRDQCVIMQDVGGDHDGHVTWLDLRAPDALVDALTDPYGPGRARLKSWSGRADREVAVGNL